MAKSVEKLEQEIKDLQARKRALRKKEKERQMKDEFKRLQEVEKKFNDYMKNGDGRYAKQGTKLSILLSKNGIKTFDDGFQILEQALASRNNQ